MTLAVDNTALRRARVKVADALNGGETELAWTLDALNELARLRVDMHDVFGALSHSRALVESSVAGEFAIKARLLDRGGIMVHVRVGRSVTVLRLERI